MSKTGYTLAENNASTACLRNSFWSKGHILKFSFSEKNSEKFTKIGIDPNSRFLIVNINGDPEARKFVPKDVVRIKKLDENDKPIGEEIEFKKPSEISLFASVVD